ncbi:hypothetical protein GCM10009632_39020 [Mycolicibacterium alvei]|uniref:ESX-1 secretion-associated protein n=2 Tax=Mycolicibacterium alvei TaxID=67081 RepID=A0A6N4UST3_9MYCO|nr:type VII secretion target [Mycolicibacterium alvei]MCV7002209.1 hypothetical protein [Mycolicibacterium alvei]BBX27449.1 hypothetical protein MALV_25740 [Mycolicibacterium alvei]
MLVDPEVLRTLASQADAASSTISSADVGSKATSAADGLPGSTTQWAARTVGEHFSNAAIKLADNVTKMGQAVRGAGDAFEVADDALASNFDGLF